MPISPSTKPRCIVYWCQFGKRTSRVADSPDCQAMGDKKPSIINPDITRSKASTIKSTALFASFGASVPEATSGRRIPQAAIPETKAITTVLNVICWPRLNWEKPPPLPTVYMKAKLASVTRRKASTIKSTALFASFGASVPEATSGRRHTGDQGDHDRA